MSLTAGKTRHLVSAGLRVLASSRNLPPKSSSSVRTVISPTAPTTVRLCSSQASVSSEVKKPSCTPINLVADHNNDWLVVNWLDGSRSDFPYVWLRDNCQCPKCFQPDSRARILLMQDLDVNIRVQHTEISEEGMISVVWPDGHESLYHSEWLKERDFSKSQRTERAKAFDSPKQLWESRDMVNLLHRDDYKAVMASPERLLKWLRSLQKHGLALLKDVGPRNSFKEFTKHLGFPRITHYGEMFHVKSKGSPTSLAYTDEKLNFHIDLPYYDYLPGVQILHCITQCDGHGGETEFADGFRIVEHMKEHHPEHYNLLVNVPLQFYNIGKDFISFHKILKTPIIRLNNEGKVWQIRYNNGLRDPFMDIEASLVKPMYEALKMFDDYLYNPRFNFPIKLQDGEMVAFDNWRLLHGRNSFTSSKDNVRELEGGYIDWDEVYSRIRVLEDQINNKK